MDFSNITSMYSDVYANAANQSASRLKNQLNSDHTNSSDDELMEVCKQFESYFLEQVFKEMQKTIPNNDNSDSSTSQLVDYFKDQMIQEIASESTEQSSLGLAQMLYEQMKRNMGVDASRIPVSATEAAASEASRAELS